MKIGITLLLIGLAHIYLSIFSITNLEGFKEYCFSIMGLVAIIIGAACVFESKNAN